VCFPYPLRRASSGSYDATTGDTHVTHASSCSHTRLVRLLVRVCSADLSLCRGGIGCAYSAGVLSLSISRYISRRYSTISIDTVEIGGWRVTFPYPLPSDSDRRFRRCCLRFIFLFSSSLHQCTRTWLISAASPDWRSSIG
jgi:hypothetical protein